jgi:hypothetical protein
MKGLIFIAAIFQIVSKPCFIFYVRRLEDTENLLNGDAFTKKKLKDDKFVPMFKERKKHDRFNGMPEEEVSKRTLPDHLALNLDIVIVSTALFEWLKYASKILSLVCLCVQIVHLCCSVILFLGEGTKSGIVVQ